VTHHRIRLHAAWTPVERTDGSSRAVGAKLDLPVSFPADAIPRGLRRVFHRPTGLAGSQKLALFFEWLPAGTRLELNGCAISASEHAAGISFPLDAADLLEINEIVLSWPGVIVGRGLQSCGTTDAGGLQSRGTGEPMATGEPISVGAAWLEILQ
jgi:hypothetical protein